MSISTPYHRTYILSSIILSILNKDPVDGHLDIGDFFLIKSRKPGKKRLQNSMFSSPVKSIGGYRSRMPESRSLPGVFRGKGGMKVEQGNRVSREIQRSQPRPRYYAYFQSPVGRLWVAGDGEFLEWIGFPEEAGRIPQRGWEENGEVLREPILQLKAFFAGTLRQFDLRLSPEGTPFQREVWRSLQEVPYGATISYGGLAEKIGKPGAARAVGGAVGRNPLPIVIPCHRVIGRNGNLTGFGGGLEIKKRLLSLERGTPLAVD
jgi:methylated-DNA-[protein]-cysteine S-methyltransferase